MSEIDNKLDQIIEKLAISKLDNSFLLSFSILSVLFSLSNVVLTDLGMREIITIGAILYFISSFFVGYFMGAIRDNWACRVWGWVWMTLSTSLFTAMLVWLMIWYGGIWEGEPTKAVLFAVGLVLAFGSIGSILLVKFFKAICVVTPTLRDHLSSIWWLHRRYLDLFIGSAINKPLSKINYLTFSVFLSVGVILIIISL